MLNKISSHSTQPTMLSPSVNAETVHQVNPHPLVKHEHFNFLKWDKILNLARNRGLTDKDAWLDLEKIQEKHLPQLESTNLDRLVMILCTTFVLKCKDENAPEVKITLASLFESIKSMNDKKIKATLHDLEIIGGLVHWVLGPGYYTKAMIELFGEEIAELLTPEMLPSLSTIPQDADFRSTYSNISYNTLVEFRNCMIDFIGKKQDAFIDDELRQKIIKTFLQADDFVAEEINPCCTVAIQNSNGMKYDFSFTFVDGLTRLHLFLRDALRISIKDMRDFFIAILRKSPVVDPKIVPQSDTPDRGWQCLFDRVARIIHVDNIESVNSNAWPVFTALLAQSYRYFQPDIGTKLLDKVIKSCKSMAGIAYKLKKYLHNHHQKDPLIALPMFLNAFSSLQKMLPIDNINEIWQAFTFKVEAKGTLREQQETFNPYQAFSEELSNIKDENTKGALSVLANAAKFPIEYVYACLQVAAFHSMNLSLEEEPQQILQAFPTKSDGKTCIQIHLREQGRTYTVLQEFKPEAAFGIVFSQLNRYLAEREMTKYVQARELLDQLCPVTTFFNPCLKDYLDQLPLNVEELIMALPGMPSVDSMNLLLSYYALQPSDQILEQIYMYAPKYMHLYHEASNSQPHKRITRTLQNILEPNGISETNVTSPLECMLWIARSKKHLQSSRAAFSYLKTTLPSYEGLLSIDVQQQIVKLFFPDEMVMTIRCMELFVDKHQVDAHFAVFSFKTCCQKCMEAPHSAFSITAIPFLVSYLKKLSIDPLCNQSLINANLLDELKWLLDQLPIQEKYQLKHALSLQATLPTDALIAFVEECYLLNHESLRDRIELLHRLQTIFSTRIPLAYQKEIRKTVNTIMKDFESTSALSVWHIKKMSAFLKTPEIALLYEQSTDEYNRMFMLLVRYSEQYNCLDADDLLFLHEHILKKMDLNKGADHLETFIRLALKHISWHSSGAPHKPGPCELRLTKVMSDNSEFFYSYLSNKSQFLDALIVTTNTISAFKPTPKMLKILLQRCKKTLESSPTNQPVKQFVAQICKSADVIVSDYHSALFTLCVTIAFSESNHTMSWLKRALGFVKLNNDVTQDLLELISQAIKLTFLHKAKYDDITFYRLLWALLYDLEDIVNPNHRFRLIKDFTNCWNDAHYTLTHRIAPEKLWELEYAIRHYHLKCEDRTLFLRVTDWMERQVHMGMHTHQIQSLFAESLYYACDNFYVNDVELQFALFNIAKLFHSNYYREDIYSKCLDYLASSASLKLQELAGVIVLQNWELETLSENDEKKFRTILHKMFTSFVKGESHFVHIIHFALQEEKIKDYLNPALLQNAWSAVFNLILQENYITTIETEAAAAIFIAYRQKFSSFSLQVQFTLSSLYLKSLIAYYMKHEDIDTFANEIKNFITLYESLHINAEKKETGKMKKSAKASSKISLETKLIKQSEEDKEKIIFQFRKAYVVSLITHFKTKNSAHDKGLACIVENIMRTFVYMRDDFIKNKKEAFELINLFFSWGQLVVPHLVINPFNDTLVKLYAFFEKNNLFNYLPEKWFSIRLHAFGHLGVNFDKKQIPLLRKFLLACLNDPKTTLFLVNRISCCLAMHRMDLKNHHEVIACHEKILAIMLETPFDQSNFDEIFEKKEHFFQQVLLNQIPKQSETAQTAFYSFYSIRMQLFKIHLNGFFAFYQKHCQQPFSGKILELYLIMVASFYTKNGFIGNYDEFVLFLQDCVLKHSYQLREAPEFSIDVEMFFELLTATIPNISKLQCKKQAEILNDWFQLLLKHQLFNYLIAFGINLRTKTILNNIPEEKMRCELLISQAKKSLRLLNALDSI